MPMLPDQWLVLSAYERDALLAVVQRPGSTSRELHARISTEDFRIDPHAITNRPLKTLEDEHLVTRGTHEQDNRSYVWHPTREGRRLLQEVREVWGE